MQPAGFFEAIMMAGISLKGAVGICFAVKDVLNNSMKRENDGLVQFDSVLRCLQCHKKQRLPKRENGG